jgi:hypothetical protein
VVPPKGAPNVLLIMTDDQGYPLFISGYEFETPIPLVTREGVKPFPPTGYRTLDARSYFFYGITGITQATTCPRLLTLVRTLR